MVFFFCNEDDFLSIKEGNSPFFKQDIRVSKADPTIWGAGFSKIWDGTTVPSDLKNSDFNKIRCSSSSLSKTVNPSVWAPCAKKRLNRQEQVSSAVSELLPSRPVKRGKYRYGGKELSEVRIRVEVKIDGCFV